MAATAQVPIVSVQKLLVQKVLVLAVLVLAVLLVLTLLVLTVLVRRRGGRVPVEAAMASSLPSAGVWVSSPGYRTGGGARCRAEGGDSGRDGSRCAKEAQGGDGQPGGDLSGRGAAGVSGQRAKLQSLVAARADTDRRDRRPDHVFQRPDVDLGVPGQVRELPGLRDVLHQPSRYSSTGVAWWKSVWVIGISSWRVPATS